MALSNRTLVVAVVGMGVLVAGLNIAEAGKRGGFSIRIGGNKGGLQLHHIGNHHNGNHNHHGNHHHHGHHHHHHGHHHHWHNGWYVGYPYYGYPGTIYSNPYVVVPSTPVVDPIGPNAEPNGDEDGGSAELDAARDAFMSGNYDAATQSLSQALSKNSKDPNALQLQSLVFFAQGKFREAAGLAHAALTSGRGWNWETVRGLYPSTEMYTSQLRRLEQSIDASPNDAASRFLLGYHYLIMGHNPQAARQLQKVVELQPSDKFAAELLKQLSGQGPQNGGNPAPAGPATPNTDTNDDGPEADAGDALEAGSDVESNENGLDALGTNDTNEVVEPALPVSNEKTTRVGTFTATPVDGVKIQLSLRADQTFVWSVDAKGKKTQFTGTFTIENGELTLTNKADGKKMTGTMTEKADGSFNFKMKGGQADDPGLNFSRNA